ncbi:MAG: hypothetical protein ACP6IP_01960 [Candidatus Njordarchaeia archaeon]
MVKQFKVVRKWKTGKIINFLCEADKKSLGIKPGDIISIGEHKLPIFEISHTVSGYKISAVSELDLPETRFIEIIKVSPKKGEVAVIGEIPNPIVSILRQNGYEVVTNYNKDTDLIIVTSSTIKKLPEKGKILIAPESRLTLQDYHYLNKVLMEMGFGVTYNLNKPINLQKSKIVEVAFYSRKIVVPANIHAYSLKVKDGEMLANLKKGYPIIVAKPEKRTIFASSIMLFYPYELIFDNGENAELLLDIIDTDFSKLESERKEETEEVIIEGRSGRNEFYMDLGGITEYRAFSLLLEKLIKFGAVLKERNDSLKKARLTMRTAAGTNLDINFSIYGGKVIISTDKETDEDASRTLRSIRLFLEAIINELNREKLKADELKLLIRIMARAFKRLLTIKDMVELDINFGEIKEELLELISLLNKGKVLSGIASKIDGYLRENLAHVNVMEPLPKDLKSDLMEKIDNWYEEITEKVEKFVD